jgi:hypothetical protein
MVSLSASGSPAGTAQSHSKPTADVGKPDVELLGRHQLLHLHRAAGDQRHLDAVAALDEAAEHVRQQKHRRAGHGNDPQHAALQLTETAQGLCGRFQPAEDLLGLLEQIMGFGHRMQAPAAALEQAASRIRLEAGYHGADRRLGPTQIARRLGNRARQHDFAEGGKLFQVHGGGFLETIRGNG